MKKYLFRFTLPVFFGIFLVVFPSAGQTKQSKEKEKPMLQCRVIVEEITTKPDVPNEIAILEVELKNVSDKAIKIGFTRAPAILQYMRGEVQRPDGTVLKFRCADYLSPFSPDPTIFTLQPGQVTKAAFGSEGAQGPGIYRIQAIFEYEKMKAVSPVVEVKLKPLKKK